MLDKMIYDTLEALAEDLDTLQIKILKYTHPKILIDIVCKSNGLEVWEYEDDVYKEFQNIVKLVFSNQIENLPFRTEWGL